MFIFRPGIRIVDKYTLHAIGHAKHLEGRARVGLNQDNVFQPCPLYFPRRISQRGDRDLDSNNIGFRSITSQIGQKETTPETNLDDQRAGAAETRRPIDRPIQLLNFIPGR